MQSTHGNTGAAGAAIGRIELGWQVYDALDRPLGNVADIERDRGQLRVDGRPVGFDFFEVPLGAVRQVRDEDVVLSLQLDARTVGDDRMPRWTNGAAAGTGAAPAPHAGAVARATDAPRLVGAPGAAGGGASAAGTSWSSTIEHPNIRKVGETQTRDVPIWTEGRSSSATSYLPWAGAAGLGMAGAVGYYWWRQSRRKSAWERALDYVGGTFSPVYEQARERPAWAAALGAAAIPLAWYLRSGREEESTVEAARGRLLDTLPFTSRDTWRDTASAWWESAPSVREGAASLLDAVPALKAPRVTLRDYLTREEESDWLTWPLGAAAIGMIVGAIWYLLSRGSEESETRSGERISDVMTMRPEVIRPDATVFEAASLMRRLNVGAVPVCDGTRLLGMITDRDIAIRSAAEGNDPHLTLVRDVMTKDVAWAFEDEPVERAADLMRERQVRRLPIVNRDKRLVGIVSLGDLAVEGGDDALSGSTLEDISEPARPRR